MTARLPRIPDWLLTSVPSSLSQRLQTHTLKGCAMEKFAINWQRRSTELPFY